MTTIDYMALVNGNDDFNDNKTITISEFKAWMAGFMVGKENMSTEDVATILTQVAKITERIVPNDMTPFWPPLAPPLPNTPNPYQPPSNPWTFPPHVGDTPPKPLEVWYSDGTSVTSYTLR